MSITAKELAKRLQLSEAAVSMALNNKPGVSTATRQRVLSAAKEGGYDFTKLKEASPESGPERGTVAFMIYRKHGAVVTDTPFFNQLTEGISVSCRQAHYRLNIHYIHEDESNHRQLKDMPYCDGIILLATEMHYEDFKLFDSLQIPIVVLDTYFESLKYDCVLINNFQGAYQATDYLIRKTKKQPGYLRSSYPIGNFDERADGFYKALRTHGMSASKSKVLSLTPSMEGSYEDTLQLLQAGEEPASCYFADNDLIAAGAIKAFKEYGYRIPADISIIGFDNMPLCNYIDPPLTTVNVPNLYMAQMAVERLIQRINSKEHFPVKVEINTHIVQRKSVLYHPVSRLM